VYKRILAAIDWTESTQAVLDQTRRLASLTGASVHVVHVRATDFQSVPQMLGSMASRTPLGESVETEAGGVARRMIEDAVAALVAAGVDAEGVLLDSAPGNVPRTVLERARELDVELIVLGSRNHTRPSALFRSNVADEVSRQATCPVLIVP
jgi:nucleotide-binding universal stress UspA family protein